MQNNFPIKIPSIETPKTALPIPNINGGGSSQKQTRNSKKATPHYQNIGYTMPYHIPSQTIGSYLQTVKSPEKQKLIHNLFKTNKNLKDAPLSHDVINFLNYINGPEQMFEFYNPDVPDVFAKIPNTEIFYFFLPNTTQKTQESIQVSFPDNINGMDVYCIMSFFDLKGKRCNLDEKKLIIEDQQMRPSSFGEINQYFSLHLRLPYFKVTFDLNVFPPPFIFVARLAKKNSLESTLNLIAKKNIPNYSPGAQILCLCKNCQKSKYDLRDVIRSIFTKGEYQCPDCKQSKNFHQFNYDVVLVERKVIDLSMALTHYLPYSLSSIESTDFYDEKGVFPNSSRDIDEYSKYQTSQEYFDISNNLFDP